MGRRPKTKGSRASGSAAQSSTAPADLQECANMVDRVNNDLEQDILRQRLQVPLIIFDSEAMYDEVYQLKAQAYQVLESERVPTASPR